MMENMFYNPLFYPNLPTNCDKPPTIYAILNSIVNFGNPIRVKNNKLAEAGRAKIFNFDYPLSANVRKDYFEKMILSHFFMRRIGFETLTAFQIQLEVKLNEIMPLYNKMFDSLENWNIFNDGEVLEKTSTDDRKTTQTATSNNSLTNKSDRTDTVDNRKSDTPQNRIEEIQSGEYLSEYSFNKSTGNDNSTSTGSSNANTSGNDVNKYTETTKRSPADKIAILKEMQENIKNIYTLIFEDLEDLFYQVY